MNVIAGSGLWDSQGGFALCSASLQVKPPIQANWPGPDPVCHSEQGGMLNNKGNSGSQTLKSQMWRKLGLLPGTPFSQNLSCFFDCEIAKLEPAKTWASGAVSQLLLGDAASSTGCCKQRASKISGFTFSCGGHCRSLTATTAHFNTTLSCFSPCWSGGSSVRPGHLCSSTACRAARTAVRHGGYATASQPGPGEEGKHFQLSLGKLDKLTAVLPMTNSLGEHYISRLKH